MTVYSPLASPSATSSVLKAHDLAPKYSLGQNFLINDAIIGKILDLADIKPGAQVLEIGPGIGTLTLGLLRAGAHVVSIERDPDLPAVLSDTLAGYEQEFSLVKGDALNVSPAEIFEKIDNPVFQMVANLPYAVAATVVLDYFQKYGAMQSATVMVQREVAERMAAHPGTKNYGAYTVKLSLYTSVIGSFAVAPGNFMPAPRVESSVIRLDKRSIDDPLYTNFFNKANINDTAIEREKLLAAAATMADASFASRRKTIANSCKSFFASRDKKTIDHLPQIFEGANIDPKIRGEALLPKDYLRMGVELLRSRGELAG